MAGALFLLLKVPYYDTIILGVYRLIRGAFAPTFISRRKNAMKVNPKTVKFVLDLVAALAVTAAGVVAKYYIDVPQD